MATVGVKGLISDLAAVVSVIYVEYSSENLHWCWLDHWYVTDQ